MLLTSVWDPDTGLIMEVSTDAGKIGNNFDPKLVKELLGANSG